jgi:hypothetical protein
MLAKGSAAKVLTKWKNEKVIGLLVVGFGSSVDDIALCSTHSHMIPACLLVSVHIVVFTCILIPALAWLISWVYCLTSASPIVASISGLFLTCEFSIAQVTELSDDSCVKTMSTSLDQ